MSAAPAWPGRDAGTQAVRMRRQFEALEEFA
jgi:hypothetical protein